MLSLHRFSRFNETLKISPVTLSFLWGPGRIALYALLLQIRCQISAKWDGSQKHKLCYHCQAGKRFQNRRVYVSTKRRGREALWQECAGCFVYFLEWLSNLWCQRCFLSAGKMGGVSNYTRGEEKWVVECGKKQSTLLSVCSPALISSDTSRWVCVEICVMINALQLMVFSLEEVGVPVSYRVKCLLNFIYSYSEC